jgi:nucleotide-binding universal stress UspA family protein
MLDIVHAIDERRSPAIAAQREAEVKQLLEDARNEAEHSLPATGIHDVVASFEWGTPFKIIANRAHHGRAELVVLGRRGERQLSDVILGSTADRVVRSGSVSVLVVATEPSAPYRRPLVAVDMSDSSRSALELAARICDPAINAIDVVHVVSFRPHRGSRRHEQTVRDEVASFAGALNVGVRWNVIVKFGEPRAAILDAANEHGTDLIALGTKGRSGLSRMLLGSLAEGVLRDASCDVLLARLPEFP